MIRIVKKVVPPIVFDLLKPGLSKSNRKIYSSHEEALQHCTPGAYEEEELIKVVLAKTKKLANSNFVRYAANEAGIFGLVAIANLLVKENKRSINVIDFGGACGAQYFQLRSLLDGGIELNWAVIETPMMVKYASELSNEHLNFFDNFGDAVNKLGTIDLLLTSGTLQCVNDAEEYLDRLLRVNANWLVFGRLGLNKDDRDVITIHASKLSWNGVGSLPAGYADRWVRIPFCFLSEHKFIRKVTERYSIFLKFDDSSGMYSVKGNEIVGYGLVLKNRFNR